MKIYTKPCLTVENLLSRETVADGVTHDTSSMFGPSSAPILGAAPNDTGEVNVSVTSGIGSDWYSIINGSN